LCGAFGGIAYQQTQSHAIILAFKIHLFLLHTRFFGKMHTNTRTRTHTGSGLKHWSQPGIIAPSFGWEKQTM
jgi:hypothetical protein